jgi:hypothetical protein
MGSPAIRRYWWIAAAVAVVAVLIVGEIVINSSPPAPSPAARAADDTTMKEIMDSIVDPNAEFVFSAIQTVADENGVSEKAPQTEAEWIVIRRRLAVLATVPDLLTAPGRRAARPEDRSINPLVENEPAQTQILLEAGRSDLLRHARQFRDTLGAADKAAASKDKVAFSKALTELDKACESCHLRFFYPNDKRAQDAAREEGLTQ